MTQVKESARVSEQLPSTRHTLSGEMGQPCLQLGSWVQLPGEKRMLDQHSVKNVDPTDLYLLTFILRGECFLISLKKKRPLS